MDRKVISKLLGISEKSFYRWKEERLIFKLLVLLVIPPEDIIFCELPEVYKKNSLLV